MDPTVVVTGMLDAAAMLAALLACFAAVYSSWAFLIPSTQFCIEEKYNPDNWVDKMALSWDSLGWISMTVNYHLMFTSVKPLWLQGWWSSSHSKWFSVDTVNSLWARWLGNHGLIPVSDREFSVLLQLTAQLWDSLTFLSNWVPGSVSLGVNSHSHPYTNEVKIAWSCPLLPICLHVMVLIST